MVTLLTAAVLHVVVIIGNLFIQLLTLHNLVDESTLNLSRFQAG